MELRSSWPCTQVISWTLAHPDYGCRGDCAAGLLAVFLVPSACWKEGGNLCFSKSSKPSWGAGEFGGELCFPQFKAVSLNLTWLIYLQISPEHSVMFPWAVCEEQRTPFLHLSLCQTPTLWNFQGLVRDRIWAIVCCFPKLSPSLSLQSHYLR